MLDWEVQEITRFMDEAMQRFSPGDRAGKRLLDFGCGTGRLIENLTGRGYTASEGCDIDTFWSASNPVASRLSVIGFEPYRLPYEDRRFDVVISTSVLEHAQNKEELFTEIHRVLKPGGVAIHLYPSKWYLPSEPHIFVPLANVFWPRVPTWWLSLWAWAGVRNDYQKQMAWREVSATNAAYCRDGLTYWSHAAYRKLSMAVFGHYSDETTYFVQHGYGGAANGLRRLPIPASLAGAICSTLRMSLLVNIKPAAGR